MLRFLDNLNNNPIYLKEIKVRERLNSRRKFQVPACTGYIAILLFPIAMAIILSLTAQQLTPDNLKSVFMITVFLQVLYFIFRGGSHAWGLISGEKEMKTYENLISTVMSPDEIVQGKFQAVFFPLSKELTLLFPVFAAIGILLQIQLFFLVQVYLQTLFLMALFTMVGIYFSNKEKTTAEARINTIRMIAFLLVITLIMVPVLAVLENVDTMFSLPMFPSIIIYVINPFMLLWMMRIMITASVLEASAFLLFLVCSAFSLLIYTLILWTLYRRTTDMIGEIPE